MYVPELREEIASLEEFRSFTSRHRIFDPEYREMLIGSIRQNGLICDFTGDSADASQVAIATKNYRETITYAGINSRGRAVLLELSHVLSEHDRREVRILCTEAQSRFALLLRGIFPRFLGTEYAESPEKRSTLFPIPVEDIQNLSFVDSCFDIIITNDVLEHVPDIGASIREMYRVLTPGGVVLATVPFLVMEQKTRQCARLSNGHVEYLCSPEYHQDPLSEEGALVFQIPGWDLLDSFRKAGFASAKMVFIASQRQGIIGGDISGVMVLRADRGRPA